MIQFVIINNKILNKHDTNIKKILIFFFEKCI